MTGRRERKRQADRQIDRKGTARQTVTDIEKEASGSY